MEEYLDILNKLDSNLEKLESSSSDILYKSEKAIKITKNTLEQFRGLVINRGFKSMIEEIRFFKTLKPQLYSKLIYYVKLFNIESKRPRSSNKSQVKYLNKHIDKLQVYFNDNLEFYHYHRRCATTLDEQYFMRGREDIRLHPDTFHFFTDKQFSTSHDSTVATIMAYDMIIIHLKKEIDKLEITNSMEFTNSATPMSPSKLFWTGNKTDLIELIYALDSCGAINSGTADIKEMAAVCEQIFNIDLGNYYHTFIEIRARKSSKTKFIDKLKKTLIERFNRLDE